MIKILLGLLYSSFIMLMLVFCLLDWLGYINQFSSGTKSNMDTFDTFLVLVVAGWFAGGETWTGDGSYYDLS